MTRVSKLLVLNSHWLIRVLAWKRRCPEVELPCAETDQWPMSLRAFLSTSTIIFSVNFPVCVFCSEG